MKNFKINSKVSISESPLPYNFLAEKSILSSLLTNSGTIELILQHLTIEIFYFSTKIILYSCFSSFNIGA